MTDSMIGRVARALCESIGDDWFREGPDGLIKAYEMEARAAIEAMLEPTEAMAEFAEENFDRNSDNIKTCWRAMISAALAQPTGEKT